MAIVNRNVRHDGVNFEKGMSMKKDHTLYKLFNEKGRLDGENKVEPKEAPDTGTNKKPATTTKAPDTGTNKDPIVG